VQPQVRVSDLELVSDFDIRIFPGAIKKGITHKQVSLVQSLGFEVSLGGNDDVDATSLSVKHDFAFNQREQCVILALSNTFTGMKLVADLTDQDIARLDVLTTEFLHTTALCVRVATVSTRTLTFLVGH